MRIDYWPASAGIGSRLSCRVWRDGAQIATFADLPRDVAFVPGDYDVVIAGPALRDWTAASEAQAIVERIDVDGVTLRTNVGESVLTRAHRAYINGDFAAALAAYRELPGAEAYALMAQLELADEGALTTTMAALLGAWRAGDATLGHLLRTHRARVMPLLARLDPAGFAQVFNGVWNVALRYTEVPEIRAALLDPTLDRLTGANVDELSLLLARAHLLYRRGELERSAAVVERVLAADTADAERAQFVANAALLAARIAHRRGDAVAARTYVGRWRSSLPVDDLAAERLEVDPEDAVLLPYL